MLRCKHTGVETIRACFDFFMPQRVVVASEFDVATQESHFANHLNCVSLHGCVYYQMPEIQCQKIKYDFFISQ